jgi:hypothetical protein
VQTLLNRHADTNDSLNTHHPIKQDCSAGFYDGPCRQFKTMVYQLSVRCSRPLIYGCITAGIESILSNAQLSIFAYRRTRTWKRYWSLNTLIYYLRVSTIPSSNQSTHEVSNKPTHHYVPLQKTASLPDRQLSVSTNI